MSISKVEFIGEFIGEFEPSIPRGLVPNGGRVVIISVPVDESRSWFKALDATGFSDHRIYMDNEIAKVESQYPRRIGAIAATREVALVNFGSFARTDKILCWAKKWRFAPATPRTCFAIVEHHCGINAVLDNDPEHWVSLVSLRPCSPLGESRKVCCVSHSSYGGWHAHLSDFSGDACPKWYHQNWFIFRGKRGWLRRPL